MGIISGGNVMPSNGMATPLEGAGPPTVNVTGLGVCRVGSQYIDTIDGDRYSVASTNGLNAIIWTLVSLQVA